uniref:Uncharacterized protein n=1 Tax=viral metagenome TaxID=1070528 RepID=A0A6H2A0W8_9ZZZZ
MKWRIWKQKPWRDPWWRWRMRSQEFLDPFNSLAEAREAKANRRNDGAKTIIMPSF